MNLSDMLRGLSDDECGALWDGLVETFYTPLPPGVHILSPESRAILARAAERDAALQARHVKRGS